MEIKNAYPNTLSCYVQDGSADCAICNQIVNFGQIKYCGYCPPRCALHQIIKSSFDYENKKRRCIVCKHYTKKLNSNQCSECLSTEHLDGFEVQADVACAAWYKNMSEN